MSSFNLICWTHIYGKYFLNGSILEKCGKIWKNGSLSGQLRPDWGNTMWASTAGLGSIGLKPGSRAAVSNITSANIRLITALGTGMSLVNVTKSVKKNGTDLPTKIVQ